MSEIVWTWLLFSMEIIGVVGSFYVGNKKWYGHLIIALHSFPWAIYSLIFDKPGFLAMWFLWQTMHLRNMWKWKHDNT